MTGMVLLVCCGWTVLLCLSVQAYENIALHKPAWQSSTGLSGGIRLGAERAVDGLYKDLDGNGEECAVSHGGQTAEWRVDLGGARNIHHIVIHFETGKEVWDCPSPGYYGKNCSKECPQNCQDGYCYSVEGTCLDCKPGYIGPRCNQECPDGFYGKNCVKNCSLTCVVPGRCDRVTGRCLGGCQAGWTGDTCEKECLDRQYGYDCAGNCSLTCGDSGKCDKITGHCKGGCRTGWTGDMCDKECSAGVFGKDCAENCSMTCGDPGVCDKVTGHCNRSCLAGWEGDMCQNA
ncbi:uncharacterized protein LOC111113844 [Crassostrea virginica]